MAKKEVSLLEGLTTIRKKYLSKARKDLKKTAKELANSKDANIKAILAQYKNATQCLESIMSQTESSEILVEKLFGNAKVEKPTKKSSKKDEKPAKKTSSKKDEKPSKKDEKPAKKSTSKKTKEEETDPELDKKVTALAKQYKNNPAGLAKALLELEEIKASTKVQSRLHEKPQPKNAEETKIYLVDALIQVCPEFATAVMDEYGSKCLVSEHDVPSGYKAVGHMVVPISATDGDDESKIENDL